MEEQNKTFTETTSPPPIEQKDKKKPKWLRVLETQSWQAELIISGLAIFGSLQLPSVLNGLIDFAVYQLPSSMTNLGKYFFIYLLLAVNVLIINFIIHFILRTIWIGMLGLVSVYPKGINPDFDFYTGDYMQKLLKEFPDINGFNQQLDDMASVIFALSAVTVMFSVSVSTFIIFLGLVSFLISSLVSVVTFDGVFLTLGAVLLILGMSQSFLAHKKIRDKAWVKKIHFPIFKTFSKLLLHIFYKPMNYIYLTFFTNSKVKNFFVAYFAYLFLLIFSFVPTMLNSNLTFLDNRVFFRHHNNQFRIYAAQYEDQLPENTRIMGSIIPSNMIDQPVLELFIPRFKREQASVDSLNVAWEYNDNLSEEENLKNEWNARIENHDKYYQIYLNDSLITNLKFYNHYHQNKGEKGFLTYISTENCRPGNNLLKIVRQFKDEKGKPKQEYLPFQFVGKKVRNIDVRTVE